MLRFLPILISQADTSHSNKQLQLLVQGWVGIALLAAVGALGLAVIAVLLAVWRRSLDRHRALEVELRELRSSVTAIGDAWAASSARMGGPGPHRPSNAEPDDEDDDEDEEDEDPYNLFGGRDPLDRDGDEDEDDDDYPEDEDDEDPPPGF